MIDVEAHIEEGMVRLDVSGHADAGPHGQDIVCAAVSAVVQTCIIGLQRIAEEHPAHVQMRVTVAE